MSLDTLEKGFRLVWGYLSVLKKRKETDFKKLEWSFDELIKMCEGESFIKQANQLKSLLTAIVNQKEVNQKNINLFKKIWKSID